MVDLLIKQAYINLALLVMVVSCDYYPMAAIMAGGMIPPFVDHYVTISKKRFVSRKEALMNYIMEFHFI